MLQQTLQLQAATWLLLWGPQAVGGTRGWPSDQPLAEGSLFAAVIGVCMTYKLYLSANSAAALSYMAAPVGWTLSWPNVQPLSSTGNRLTSCLAYASCLLEQPSPWT